MSHLPMQRGESETAVVPGQRDGTAPDEASPEDAGLRFDLVARAPEVQGRIEAHLREWCGVDTQAVRDCFIWNGLQSEVDPGGELDVEDAFLRRAAARGPRGGRLRVMGFSTVERTVPDALFTAVYRGLFAQAFPPEELDGEDVLAAALDGGAANLFAVVDDAGAPVAAAFGEWSESSRVQLLTYLAVGPAARGGGIGGRLLRDAVNVWSVRRDPCIVVAEIEDPHAPAHDAHGDPRRRLAFYEAAGARVLDVPYFQPGIGGPGRRVRGMLLLVLHAAPAFTRGAAVAGAPLRTFMEEYLAEAEGRVGDDADARTLLAAFDRPGGVPADRWRAAQ